MPSTRIGSDGLAQAAGSRVGPLVAGPLAEWAPDPLRLSYLALLAATVAGGALMLTMPEPAANRGGSSARACRLRFGVTSPVSA